MYGAIIGDIVGSPYEFGESPKRKDVPFFITRSRYTDDSMMTVAVADALMDSWEQPACIRKKTLIDSMQKWGQLYPDAGYGRSFYRWIFSDNPKPYNSWGNGSAMRVSSVGWLYSSLEETEFAAKDTAAVTHNHPEGIKGAMAAASVIWLARNGRSRQEIRKYVEENFYPLKKTCDEIRPTYHFDVSCQGTVPQAITAFLEGENFEDVIRTAVSLGGDCDTLACIAGGMAEAMYGVPEKMKQECRKRLEPDMVQVLERFEKFVKMREESEKNQSPR